MKGGEKMGFKKDTLKKWRLEKKYTQKEAARIFNVTQGFYSKMELGEKSPSLDTLEIITNRTGISVSDLIDISNHVQMEGDEQEDEHAIIINAPIITVLLRGIKALGAELSEIKALIKKIS